MRKLAICLVLVIMVTCRWLHFVHMCWCFCDKYKLCNSAVYLVPSTCTSFRTLFEHCCFEQCRMAAPLKSFCSQNSVHFFLSPLLEKNKQWSCSGLVLLLGPIASKIWYCQGGNGTLNYWKARSLAFQWAYRACINSIQQYPKISVFLLSCYCIKKVIFGSFLFLCVDQRRITSQ